MPTGIHYLDEVWNPISGCSGQGCKVKDTCWAAAMVKRFPAIHYTGDILNHLPPFEEVVFHPDRLDKPLHWRKPRRIGVCFMGDMFDEGVFFRWIHEVWDVMKRCPQHTFFTLTKQPHIMLEMVGFVYRKEAFGHAMGFWSHVYNGLTITDQDDADTKLPEILRVPGNLWLSIEPFLQGPIDIDWALGKIESTRLPYIGWVVVGCHSNPRLYPCPIEWIESIVEQCRAAGVPVYVKQVMIDGKCVRDFSRFPEAVKIRELPN